MCKEISINYHSSVRIENIKKIYIDPFKISEAENDADIILITHSHYDHFSEEDILKVKNDKTIIYITKDLYDKTKDLGFIDDNIHVVTPNNNYIVDDNINIYTMPAYNINREFHKKENNWVGYIIDINNKKYYISGDTDITEENKNVICDIAIVAIGGTYTMDYNEAAELINIIKPQIAIPMHYNSIVGSSEDGMKFKEKVDENIKCKIII